MKLKTRDQLFFSLFDLDLYCPETLSMQNPNCGLRRLKCQRATGNSKRNNHKPTLVVISKLFSLTSTCTCSVDCKIVKKVKVLVGKSGAVSHSVVSISLEPMGFSRQEYWSGLPFPSPGDLTDPGIEPSSPALQWILHCLSHQGSLGLQDTTLLNITLSIHHDRLLKHSTVFYHYTLLTQGDVR